MKDKVKFNLTMKPSTKDQKIHKDIRKINNLKWNKRKMKTDKKIVFKIKEKGKL